MALLGTATNGYRLVRFWWRPYISICRTHRCTILTGRGWWFPY